MAILLALLAVAALIQVRGQPLSGGRASGGVVTPLERAAGGDTPVLTLRARRGTVRLLLDSGASSTMVTPQLAARLGLVSRDLPAQRFALAGGGSGCASLQPKRTQLPALELQGDGSGRWRLQGIESLVLPAAALPPGIDGVLGAPTLRLAPFWIDPRGQRLAFGADALRLAGSTAVGGAQAPVAGPLQLPLRWHQGVPLMTLRTLRGPVEALLDSGAEGLFISTGLAARLSSSGPGRPLRLVGVCGEQLVEQRAYPGFGLVAAVNSGATPPRQAAAPASSTVLAIITANPIFQALGVEAIVGQELLRDRRQLWRLDLASPRLELH